MNGKITTALIIIFFALFSLFTFRQYVINQRVPLNGNLLVSFYQPWASYKWGDYNSGIPSKPIGFDALRIFYPTRKVVIDQLKNGNMPLWNPFQFSGNVLLATFQSAILFPLGILFLVMPQIDAWSIIVLLQSFLGSLFMFLFLSQILKDKRAIFFGSLTFAYSGILICWWEEMFMAGYSVIILPLLLYSIEKVFQKIQIRSVLFLCAVSLFSLSTGWFQMIFYSWIFAVYWTFFRFYLTRDKKAMILTFLTFLTSGIMSGIHLVPSIEAYAHSVRGVTDAGGDFQTYLMPIHHIITYVIPDIFGNPAYHNYFGRGFYQESVLSIGIVGLVFALYELFTLKRNKKIELFFIITWIISLSLGFSLPTSWFILYDLRLPFVSTLLPSRIFFVSAFCISILASFGMEQYLREKIKTKQFIAAVSLIAFVFLGVFIFLYVGKTFSLYNIKNLQIILRNSLLPLFLFLLTVFFASLGILKKNLKSSSYTALIIISLVSMTYFTQKYLYFAPKSFIFPQTPVLNKLQKVSGINRYLSVGDGYIERNFSMFYGLYSPEGYDSFNNKRYNELIYTSKNYGKLTAKIARADSQIMWSKSTLDTLSNPYRKSIVDLLGVKYLVEKNNKEIKQVKENSDIKQIWTDNIFTIYENKNVIPRIFMAYDYSVLKNDQQIISKIYDKNTNLAKTIILESEPDLAINNEGQNNLKILSYRSNYIFLNIKTSENGLLMLTDNMYPGWKAYINGKITPIYRADFTFRALGIPKGEYNVEFKYESDAFYIGTVVSAVGLLLLACLLYLARKKV